VRLSSPLLSHAPGETSTRFEGEYFVAVVGTNLNKVFKVKTRMFKALF
jgi:hypothetical protein